MSLYVELQKVKSEEDVKDAYIKAIGLKSFTKGLVDIQTSEIWFEAKDTGKHSSYAMFTQLLHYLQVAINKGDPVPKLLAVIDTEKAALMKSVDVIPFLEKKTIKWGKSASKFTQDALDQISAYIGTHFVSFKISTHEKEFLSTVKEAIKTGEIVRVQITPDNLKQVFDKWVSLIGKEIFGVDESDYALLFFADIMHDGTLSTHADLPAELLHKNGAPVFSLRGKLFELGSKEGYRQFWSIYNKPPKAEYRDYLLERRDSLIPVDERGFKGAFYTPLNIVDKAYDQLTSTLGPNWQKNYFVWDMCCGVGNLEVKHSNPRNIFMSTLDKADVDVMRATKTCVQAQRFQYDYLNDDIGIDGQIDYSITNKLPPDLRSVIASGKKILILINPPYAESGDTVGSKAKTDVAKTQIGSVMANNERDLGYATRELFAQFIFRISKEMPSATLAIFSTLKYVNSSNFEKFREAWNAKYLGGFIVHSQAFDGLKGNFPIGFLIWKISQTSIKKFPITTISTEILDKNGTPVGEKLFHNIPTKKLLSNWIVRPKANKVEVIPLKNAVTPATAELDLRGTKWADDAIGCLVIKGPDVQNASTQALLSSGYGSAGSIFVTRTNLWQIAIVFAVRGLIRPTWINNRDQFLQSNFPTSEEFKNDCLVWMLFNGQNLTAGASSLMWRGSSWNVVNHFVPFSEKSVGAPERFESDFMIKYLASKKLSKESLDLLNAGKVLWQAYFSTRDVHKVREALKLNRPDVGWYQIRNALKARNAGGDIPAVSFTKLSYAYQALSEKLQPQIFDLGFI